MHFTAPTRILTCAGRGALVHGRKVRRADIQSVLRNVEVDLDRRLAVALAAHVI